MRSFHNQRWFWAAILASWLGGCSVDMFQNQTASLGGDVAGATGNIEVAFINNTPYRAIFTYGTYNNADQFESPAAAQFVAVGANDTLEADEPNNIVTLTCDRVFSVGDAELLRLIDENGDTSTLAPEALFEGVAFSSAPLGDDNANVATEGFAPPLRALLGVDYPCGSIIIVRFEIADLGDAPFRADFEIIPPRQGDRG